MQIKEQITSNSNKYDYIIAGAGLAGLSLAYKVRKDKKLDDKRILLIDRDSKEKNDRTWCFWSKEEELFEPLLYKTWGNIQFANHDFNRIYDISPYKYKMIRGIDFYEHVIPFLKSKDNITFSIDNIESIQETEDATSVKTEKGEYQAQYVFKSYHDKIDFSKTHFVWQHFKGWVIETEENAFKPNEAMFMDFRTPQKDETRFFYVLPFSENKALVELAIFSPTIPEPEFYDSLLDGYIQEKLLIKSYNVHEEEVGAIPMTSHNFNTQAQNRIINIGTNAGSVQASSGYAFKRIQKETDKLYNCIAANKLSTYKPTKNRYQLYDNTMLNAITTGKTSGEKVFGQMFKKLSPQSVFKFLDHQGGILSDFKMFTAPPTYPFLKAFLEEIKKR